MNNRIKKVVVTGGSGKAGRACLQDLIAHGYWVFNVDNVVPANDACPFIGFAISATEIMASAVRAAWP